MSNYRHTQAWYFSMVPQIRLYSGNSLPVKTPSYKGFAGTQHLFRLTKESIKSRPDFFLGFSLETGHYSNGQTGCSFSRKYDDKTAQSDSIYSLITPDTDLSAILNRKSGNFSTNLTQLVINFRLYNLDSLNIPCRMHSITAGYIVYQKNLLAF